MRPTIYEFMECSWIVDAPDVLDEDLSQELNHLMSLEPHPLDKWTEFPLSGFLEEEGWEVPEKTSSD